MFIGVAAVAVACGLVGVRAQEPQGPREGITVHGHWAIDIKNPDGSPVLHREFENALIGSGQFALSAILSRRLVVGPWSIALIEGTTSPCGTTIVGGYTFQKRCLITELPTMYAADVPISTNLTVSSDASFRTTVLTGSFQSTEAGDLGGVKTVVGTCTAAGVCSPVDFSGTAISAITIAKGQIVQVSVTLSFS
jgi:hypothetical protein